MSSSSAPSLPPADLSANARTVLEKRYLMRDAAGQVIETPEQLFFRVARVLASVETRYGADAATVEALTSQFYTLMSERRFEPNSPTFTGAGRGHGQLSACFVLPIDDTLKNGQSGIYDTLANMAVIHQSGGGTGFSFSRLRPKGSMVKSSQGVASGPISFMGMFDASTEVVKQGGSRRGANMGILRVDHPDILEFIHCKDDLSANTNFNISVAVTTAFMEAVAADAVYDLVDPHTTHVVGQLRARDVWDQMIAGAWRTGEPGVFFIDEANKFNPVPHLGAYEATNPCITGETLVYTSEGLRPIGELAAEGRAVSVSLDLRFGAGLYGPAGVPFSSGIKPVYRLKTVEGYSVRLTAHHRVMTTRGWVEAQDLRPGDRIHLLNAKGGFGTRGTTSEGRVLGWLIGDGHITTNPDHLGAVLQFWGDDRELAPALCADVNLLIPSSAAGGVRPVGLTQVSSRKMVSIQSKRLRAVLAERYGVTAENKVTRVPPAVFAGTEDFQRGFLQSLFAADGHVAGSAAHGVSVRLTSVSLPLLEDVQRLLLNFGIVSRLYPQRHPARTVEFGGTPYDCQADHDLVVSKDNVSRFAEAVGFLHQHKQNRLLEHLAGYAGRGPYRERFVARFDELVPDGVEEVFDVTEPVTHSFVANGLVVHNCGEQNLLPYDVCNLGSVNLGFYVQGGAFQWDQMAADIHTAVRFLDNVIDANRYPLPEIDTLAKRIRRIGLGVMGFADALIRLGLCYDSEEGVEFGRRVMAFLDREAKAASERLATERGAFPEWEQSIWGPDATCARDGSSERIRPMQRLRNCNITTVAPTGTISIFAGCSSGLEPLFAVAFMRNQAGVMMPEVNADFVALAKAGGWYTDALMERIATSGTINHPEVPQTVRHVFRTANEIPAAWHVRMQAAFQQHCDAAISKTTNFAHAATVEDVRTIYEMAYALRCKGVTVYRDGSRDGQVLSTGATRKAGVARVSGPVITTEDLANLAERITDLEAERSKLEQQVYQLEGEQVRPRRKRVRPDKLRGTTVRKDTPLGVMFINITEDEERRPFEVFINLGKAGGSAMADAEALGRMISLALRSDVPLAEVVKQIRGISSDRAVGMGPHKVLSMPDAVGQALAEWEADQRGIQQALPIAGTALEPSRVETAASIETPHGQAALVVMQPGDRHEPFDSFHGACQECGAGLMVEASGCAHCLACGYSECN